MASRESAEAKVELLPPGAPLTELPGIGPKVAERLALSRISTLADLLGFFPRRYRELRELDAPEDSALAQLVRLRGTVRGTRLAFLPGRRAMVTVEFAAGDGTPFSAAFFNQPWLRKTYKAGDARIVEGELAKKGTRYSIKQPKILAASLQPVGEVQLRYAEIEGVAAARLVQWIGILLDRTDWTKFALPPLPALLREHDADLHTLVLAMHRPASVAEHERARTHFALREAVALFRAVEVARRNREQRPGLPCAVDAALDLRIRGRLPFVLTDDQEAAVQQLRERLKGKSPMGVLLQGDVGTGKTAVAVATALAVLARGHQVAFLAPTELLAEQHYALVRRWLAESGVRVELVTGSQKPADKRAQFLRLAKPGPQFVFGTHVLFSSGVEFAQLGLVVIDEQHRFGVDQRMALIQKGQDPHVLVMTATPIPRTLALTMFGDLDVVTLRQRPPGRRIVRAFHVATEAFARALRSITRAVARRGRVFVVCPAVGEDGEKGGAVRVHEALQKRFSCRLVHGRLPTRERQEALDAFRDGRCDVLIGTTVLEVGVDVAEAVLMVVVAADRFGIATLHQLRGRVGRGRRRGLCLLCGPKTERITALCRTTDGFLLAEEDLRIRGSGELLGTQQSGFSELRALDPVEDFELLMRARAAVKGTS
ncbi:MAG: DEAD/DEAH box helicase [Planctomycetes bacterium]|nr:DEAD/DEAH box helicase [Planctomycetota bacterium]